MQKFTEKQISKKLELKYGVWEEYNDASFKSEYIDGLMRLLCSYKIHSTKKGQLILCELFWFIDYNGDIIYKSTINKNILPSPITELQKLMNLASDTIKAQEDEEMYHVGEPELVGFDVITNKVTRRIKVNIDANTSTAVYITSDVKSTYSNHSIETKTS